MGDRRLLRRLTRGLCSTENPPNIPEESVVNIGLIVVNSQCREPATRNVKDPIRIPYALRGHLMRIGAIPMGYRTLQWIIGLIAIGADTLGSRGCDGGILFLTTVHVNMMNSSWLFPSRIRSPEHTEAGRKPVRNFRGRVESEKNRDFASFFYVARLKLKGPKWQKKKIKQ